MFKKLYNKIFKSKKSVDRQDTTEILKKLNKAVNPINNNLEVVYEEIRYHKIKGVMFNLGDKVICRSNECDPLMVGNIVEFWDNNGKWTNCIPQVEVDGKVWGVIGHIKPYSKKLMEILEPMRALEQWNYLLPSNVKNIYSYTQEEMSKKEQKYVKRQKIKESLI